MQTSWSAVKKGPLPRIIAHRGAPRHAPENTLSAFAAAKRLGATWVEADVLPSLDDELVIFHDNELERCTSMKGRVKDVDSADLFSLDAGSHFSKEWKDARIPSLGELLEFCRDSHLGVNLEIKHANDDELAIPNEEEIAFEKSLAAATCDMVLKYECDPTQVFFSSYSYHALEVCKERLPHIKRGLLVDHIPPNWEELTQRVDCSCMNFWIDEKANTAELIQRVSRSIPLYAYTVNDLATAETMLSWGCSGVFTDAVDQVFDIDSVTARAG
eukprot:3233905-Rhodomonas_salina.2